MARKARTIADSKNGHRHPVVALGVGQGVTKPGVLPIPIKRVKVKVSDELTLPVPRCSSAISPPFRSVHERFHLAFPLNRANLLKGSQMTKVSSRSGLYKSWRLPIQVAHIDRLVWFAELRRHNKGPMSRLRRLLRKVTSIGRKTSHGFGLVREWIVERTDIDACWIYENVLMRPLPACLVSDDVLGKRRDFGAVTSPYWDPAWFCDRWTPWEDT